MDQLKKDVLAEFTALIADVMEIIQDAEEKGEGLDLIELNKRQAPHFQALDEYFIAAKERLGGKKGLFK